MTYLEEYYKRLSEQLNERYINLQKLSLLLETPGIEDVKKHFGTMRADQFEEYMKSDPGIEERARAFRKEYLDRANAGQSSRSQSSQGSGSQSSQRSSSQSSGSQSNQGSSSQSSGSQSSQGSSSQGSSSQGSKSYYGPYSSAQGDEWAHMSDWDFNHDWIHRPENAEFKNNRSYAESAWRAAQSRANAAKNQSSQGSQSNSAGNAGQSKASPPPEPPPPPSPEPQPTSAGQRWKNAGTQSTKTIEDVITRVSNIGNNAARYAKTIPYSTIGKNVGKGAATLGVGVGVDLATQKALDSAGYKDKTGKEMIGAQVGGAASGVVGGALAGTALLPAAITGAVAGGVGYGAYKVGETIGDKTGFHDAIGNYFGGASKLNEPKTGYNGNFGTTPRYKENIKDENSKPKVVNVSDIINKIINQ